MDIDSLPTEELVNKCFRLKEAIERYSTILIFIQKTNDSDALGSAIALAGSIAVTFKNEKKNIYIVGYKQKPGGIAIQERFILPEDFLMDEENTLGISVDVFMRGQLTNRKLVNKCKEFFIVDHHENNKLKEELKQDAVLICNNYYKSCCGLVFKILKMFKWRILEDTLSLIARGHRSDSECRNDKGVGEIYSELAELNVGCMQIIENRHRCRSRIYKALCKVFLEGEWDKGTFFATFTRKMAIEAKNENQKVFTFPMLFFSKSITDIDNLIYFHYLLTNEEKHPTRKHIYIIPVLKNEALEELLLANGFLKERNWFHKIGDLMEFKEFYRNNGRIFNCS